MTIVREHIDLLLPLIAILSIIALASNKPSRSAIFLFLQAVIIDIFIAITYGLNTIIFLASILLTFFVMIAFGCNYYFEISFKKATSKPPRLNIAIGFFLFILFWRYTRDLFSQQIEMEQLHYLNLNYDGLSMVVAGFALFSILMSALIVFDLKNPKSGDQT